MDGAPDALKLYAYAGVGDVCADAKRDGMDILIGFGGCATWFKVADLERVEHPFHFLTGRVHHTSSTCHADLLQTAVEEAGPPLVFHGHWN